MSRDLDRNFDLLVTDSHWVSNSVRRVMVEVRVTTTVPVRVRLRDQKPISRDCSLASELVQAGGPGSKNLGTRI